MTSNCNYLYGIVPAEQATDFGPIGLGGENVRTLVDGDIGIVAGAAAPVAFSEIQPEKTLEYLAHHQRVLERVMLDGDVLPVKFGTYAQDDAEAIRILRCGAKEFARALKKHAGKAEVDLAVSWADMKAVLAKIAGDPAVVAMKARIATLAEPTVEQRVRLGQLVKELLDQESKAVGASLADALRTRWQNIVVNPTRDDAAVLNAAVLIDRAEAAEFDQVLERLDRSYDARLKFRRVGPLPPYSFATAEVKTIPAARLDGARKLLGLGESASLAQIKAAYRRLIQEVHPDRNSEARASERLAGISEAHDLLEEYALNFPHTFSADQANPVIVTVRSLDDLRGAAGVSPRRGRAGRPDGAGAQAA